MKASDRVISLAMVPAGFSLNPLSLALIGNLRLQEPPRAVESSHYWNMLGHDWNLLLHELPDAIGANLCWGKLRACIHDSLLGIWFQEIQLSPWWVEILGTLEMPKSVGASRCQSALKALIHGSMWKREDKEASWRERITCGHQSPGTAGTGQFPGRELSSKGPSSNLEPKKKKKAAWGNGCCLGLLDIVQLTSVDQSCPTLCDPVDCSMPGLPVHHQLPEFNQTHVHWVSDVIQPSHPLSYPSPHAFNLSHHQGLFKWVSSSHQVSKVLEFQLQNQSTQRIFRSDSFRKDWLDVIAVQGILKSFATSRFKSINSSGFSFIYNPTFTSIHDYRRNNSFDYTDLCWQSDVLAF